MSVTAFKVGDRVRAKHDHSFEGEIEHVFANRGTARLMFDHPTSGYSMHIVSMAWLELVPKYTIPVAALAKIMADYFRDDYHERVIMARITEAGYASQPEPQPKIGGEIPGKCYVVRWRCLPSIPWAYVMGFTLKGAVEKTSLGVIREYSICNDTVVFASMGLENLREEEWNLVPAEGYL